MIAAVAAQKARLDARQARGGRARDSSVIVVDDLETAFDDLQPLRARAPDLADRASRATWLDKVRAAGSVFLGPWTPESVGDYCSGTNHVLPTYGFARRYSSLGVADFVRSMTVQELTSTACESIGPVAATLARSRGPRRARAGRQRAARGHRRQGSRR